MNIFLSKYVNKIDTKGRISVPASYRATIAAEHFSGIIVYPSFKNNCIEACSVSHLEKLCRMIQSLDPYSNERDAFETVILGEAVQLQFDNEGRVTLPVGLMSQVGITTQACFAGKGSVFEIWHPAYFEEHLKAARICAQDNRAFLKNRYDNLAETGEAR